MVMEAKESKIIDILTENKKYIIPAYQRPYSWDRSNTEQLISDIYDSFCQDNEEYFIGTLICIDKGGYTYEIVDGQQRLTTLSLIFAKLKDLISENKRAKENLQKRVLPIDDFSDTAQEPRLKVRNKEYDLYCHYILQGDRKFLPENPTYTQKLFIENAACIESFLLQKIDSEVGLCRLAKYILERVYVVFVKTDSFTSSFRLFDVLNTRGMPLAASDLIKNRLFESIGDLGKSHERVEEYWDKIEEVIGVDNIDRFLKINRLSQKRDRDRALGNLLDEYTNLLKNEYKDKVFPFVTDLYRSALNYQKIKDVDFEDVSVLKVLSSLTRLSDEWIPPVLSFLNRCENDSELIPEMFSDFIRMFEKCYMHGWFKQQIRSKREIICYSALVAINSKKSFSEIIKVLKLNSDNEGFEESLHQDMYEPSPNKVKFVKAVLLRMEQEVQDESVHKTYHGRITIEHILPQRSTVPYWQERFDETEHTSWLHKLGNLTLVSGARNSQAQNSAFNKKKEIYASKNKKVSFDLTKDVCTYDEWNAVSIQKRHRELVGIARRIWLV